MTFCLILHYELTFFRDLWTVLNPEYCPCWCNIFCDHFLGFWSLVTIIMKSQEQTQSRICASRQVNGRNPNWLGPVSCTQSSVFAQPSSSLWEGWHWRDQDWCIWSGLCKVYLECEDCIRGGIAHFDGTFHSVPVNLVEKYFVGRVEKKPHFLKIKMKICFVYKLS